MSYTPFPQERCPHCYERFFTPYALSAHIALMHYQSPAEREEKVGRIKRSAELAKQSRIRNETPDWTGQ